MSKLQQWYRCYAGCIRRFDPVGIDIRHRWIGEDYHDAAQQEFERIVGAYVDLDDVHERLYGAQKRNLVLFGCGAKGMTLSMPEAAFAITDARIGAANLHRIMLLAKSHPSWPGRSARLPR